jgi:ABC-type transport system substrate-binding protein
MISNGPYQLTKARNDQEIVLERNDNWGGDVEGNTTATLDKLTFKISKDQDSAYNAFEAGEGDTATIPSGRYKEANDNYATTANVSIIGSSHFVFKLNDPVVGGAKGLKLRQAISQSINRDQINEAVFEGFRNVSTGITPPGVPGHKPDLCDYCAFDLDAAKQALADWKDAGGTFDGPIKIQFNTDAGNEPIVRIMVENMKAAGIDAEAQAIDSAVYFDKMRGASGNGTDGACTFCRAGWYADYPTYDNFMWDLFSSPSAGGNNLGPYLNSDFDALVTEAKSTVDGDEAAGLYQQSEEMLLNDDIGAVPLNWYVGDYVYNPETVTNFPQNPMGIVSYEQVTMKG